MLAQAAKGLNSTQKVLCFSRFAFLERPSDICRKIAFTSPFVTSKLRVTVFADKVILIMEPEQHTTMATRATRGPCLSLQPAEISTLQHITFCDVSPW